MGERQRENPGLSNSLKQQVHPRLDCWLRGRLEAHPVQERERRGVEWLEAQAWEPHCRRLNSRPYTGDFLGGPVAKSLRSQRRGPGFDSWLRS